MPEASRREGALLRMIELAYAAPDDSEMMRSVFETLRSLVPFSSGVFMPVHEATMELQPGFCFECSMDDMARYLVHYAPLDPFVLQQPGPTLLNRTLLLSEVISGADLGRSEFSDFLRKVPYRHATGMLTGVAQQPVAVVSVHRQEHEPDFTSDEKVVLDHIGPHLARAVVLRGLARDPLQREEIGIAVFSRGGQTLFLNGAVRRFLAGVPAAVVLAALQQQGSGVLRLRSQTFRLGRLPWSAASLLRPFAEERAGLAMSDCMPGASHPADACFGPVQVPSGATIVVLRPFHPRTDLVRRLRQYGLSPRQSEIATWALRGLSNIEIARQISIGEQTVRDHFQEIYSRIGVHSRAELLTRVFGTNEVALPTRRVRDN